MGSINAIEVNGVAYDVKETHYATCSTAANSTTKYADIINGPFTLAPGIRVIVKFTYANNYPAVKLGVNSTAPSDAQTVQWQGTTPTTESLWRAGALVEFVYDGTYWQLLSPANNTTDGGSW